MEKKLYNEAVKSRRIIIVLSFFMTLINIYKFIDRIEPIFAVVAALFGGVLAYYAIPLLNNGYLKEFNSVLNEDGLTMEQIEKDLKGAPHFSDLYLGNRYAVIFGKKPKLVVYSNLVWCYSRKSTTTHIGYGISTSTSYEVIMVKRDKSEITVPVFWEPDAILILEILEDRAPGIIIGYSPMIDQIARNDFSVLINRVDKSRMQFRQ